MMQERRIPMAALVGAVGALQQPSHAEDFVRFDP